MKYCEQTTFVMIYGKKKKKRKKRKKKRKRKQML